MRLLAASRGSAGARRALRLAVAVLVVGVTVGLWATPPAWLAGPRKLTAAALGWAHTHLLTVTVAALAVSIAGLGVPFVLRRLERREAVDQQRQARDRQIMLARVRNRWIAGVLDQSLAHQARISLGLVRRADAVWQPDRLLRRPGQPAEPLPAGTPLSAVFDRLGGGLLILGAPGSGKTTALLELARDLLDRAEADPTQPLPVVFNLSSWADHRLPFDQWLIDELRSRYSVPRPISRQWLGAGELLPLLDGLDEVAAAYRSDCVCAINAFLHEHGLVRTAVCARTQEYAALAALLQMEEAVEVQPPTRQQVDGYLAAAGSDTLADVRAALEADPSLWELLSSPLVLNVVALTYQDRPAGALRAAGSSTQRLALLFTAYTDRMLAHRPGRYPPARTRRWLGWLARAMREHSQSEFHLDRLTPDWLPTPAQQRLATLIPAVSVGLLAGILNGLVSGLLGGLVHGLVGGLLLGLLFGLITGLKPTRLAEEPGWSWPRARIGLGIGLGGGLLGGLVYGLVYGPVAGLVTGLFSGLFDGLIAGLIFGFKRPDSAEELGWSWPRAGAGVVAGLGYGVTFGLSFWLLGDLLYGLIGGQPAERFDGMSYGLVDVLVVGLGAGLFVGLVGGLASGLVSERSTPNEGIRRSAHRALAIGLGGGLLVGLVVTAGSGLLRGLSYGLLAALVGGLLFGGLVCLRHLAIRGLLAVHGLAPWRSVCFLDDATEQLFLRQAGSGYLFIHRLLLEYFADEAGAEDAI